MKSKRGLTPTVGERMRHRIIFIGGVHGVGKTTLCQSLALRFKGVHHSASELISRVTQNENNKNKRTDRINKNQGILIEAINEFLNSEALCFLDGHFCLLNKQGKITRIPLSTYKAIFPLAFITLYDDPINISRRLSRRDHETYKVSLINDLQGQELNYSKEIAKGFNTPYLVCNLFEENQDKIFNFIEELLRKESS